MRFLFRSLSLLSLLPLSLEAVDYEQDIRPILEDHCLKCHGPKKQKGELRLDQRAVLLRGGDSGLPALVPGKPDESYLVEVLKDPDPEYRMPPEDEDPLTAEQIALIESWVASGADWPGQMDAVAAEMPGADHWAFQPVERPEVPIVGESHPVDAFILDALREKELSPNGPADARSLIRRASIVLTGLPPMPERVAAFEKAFAKNADAAYEALVDELLASPHFGERWAQHWLDVIRWAETNGSESNLYRKNAWMYRDYVIGAFNDDKPYDQFVSEQLAGDSLDAGVATGFLVSGPHVPAATVGREPSAIRQARADRMDEVMQTIGASMMGVTLGCARCHNHKFDPISMNDYYSMTAAFQDVEFGSRTPELAQNDPVRQRGEVLMGQLKQQREVLQSSGPWQEHWGGFVEMHFEPKKARAVRISFLTPSVGIDEIELFGPANPERNLVLAADGIVANSPARLAVEERAGVEYVNDGEYGTMTWRARTPEGTTEKPWVMFEFPSPQRVDRLRMSGNREYYFGTDYLATMPNKPNFNYRVEVQGTDGKWVEVASIPKINKANEGQADRSKAIAEIQRLIDKLAEEGPKQSFVGRFVRPVPTRVLHRGSPENPRDVVMPGAPEVLEGDLGMTDDVSGPERRARFAEWVVSQENPLTSRVMANRVWHHVFGSGIVTTTSDFGTAGALPTHPELLEWLAAEFVAPSVSGSKPWSMKGFIRFLVLSDAFRRSNRPTEEGISKDATSSLLWRFPPRRVEAEVIRDGILQASGKLDSSIGGLGYRIHNEKKTYAQWEVVKNYGEDTWRRMIYQERMRRVDDKMFTAFDFPDCGQIRAKRPVSTTPLQALNLMNSGFVIEQADLIASVAAKGGDSEAGIRRSFQLLLNREPDGEELAACLEVSNQVGLAMVCRSLMNSNEFAFLP